MSVICSDKTGTLTQNKMTVQKLYAGGEVISAGGGGLSRPDQRDLLRAALLCSDATVNEIRRRWATPPRPPWCAWERSSASTRTDLRGKYPRLAELPFDSDRKLMSTVHELDGGLTMLTKGAVDVLLDRTNYLSPGRAVEMTRSGSHRAGERWSCPRRGCGCWPSARRSCWLRPRCRLEDENDFTFLGLIAMMDPPREESKAAVAECIAGRHPAHYDHRRPQGHRLCHRQARSASSPHGDRGRGRRWSMESMTDEELR